MDRRIADLQRQTDAALSALACDRQSCAHDGWLDPLGLAAALRAGDTLLRAVRTLPDGDEPFAPEPSDGVWVVVDTAGKATIRTSPWRADDPQTTRVTAVRCDVTREPCCDAAKCQADKALHRVVLETEGGELIAAESPRPLDSVVRAFETALGLAEPDPPEEERPLPSSKALTTEELARWTLRREGSVFVLRDLASRGPRELAAREYALTIALVVGAIASWGALYLAWPQTSREAAALLLALSIVLTLASLAIWMVARFSARYTAESEALLSLAKSRLVISPWVSRSGQVDVTAEGRYGAALPLDEVDELSTEQATLLAHTSHGKYQIGECASADAAAAWRTRLEALIHDLRHVSEKKAPSARKVSGAALAALLLLGGSVTACSSEPWSPPPVTPIPPPPAPGEPPAPNPFDAPVAPSTATPPPPVTVVPQPPRPRLHLIEDDLHAARAKAKATGKALFVEVWAPWCHTCLSVKNFVLADPSLKPLEERCVFAAIDSDRPEHEAFLAKNNVNVWPTLFVLDPANSTVLGLWQGAASVDELRDFVTSSIDARDAGHDPNGPLAAMLKAKQSHAKGRWTEAARHYERAVQHGGDDWPRRSEAISGWIFSEYRRGRWKRCTELGIEHIEHIEGAAVPADTAWVVLSCADRSGSQPLAAQARRLTIARLTKHVDNPPAGSSVDDRSDALAMLAGALRAQGDRRGARRLTERQLVLLEQAAAQAPDPEHAATFDYARMGVYLKLGRGAEAIAMLRQRTTQLPGYEPHARLAEALLAMGQPGDAVASIETAIAKSYGARRLRYYGMLARAHAALGDPAAQRDALDRLLGAYLALPRSQRDHPRNADTAKDARAQLAKLP